MRAPAAVMLPTELAAALALLHPDDRRWLLGRLSDRERERLEAVLPKVEQMPAEALAAVQPLDADASGASVKPTSRNSLDEQLLRQARPEEILPLLAQLSPASRALVFHYVRWPWSEAVLARLDVLARSVVEAYPQAGARSSPLGEWLLRELAGELRLQRSAAAPHARRFEALVE
jgi:hypothetical protein